MKNKSKKLRVLSFFSGAMGLDLGLEAAGLEVVLSCEKDAACQATIKKNKPNAPLLGDICKVTQKNIIDIVGHTEFEVIVGGPPCQAFSSAGKREGFGDERGNVFLTFIELASQLQPKYIVIENVRGLLSAPYEDVKGGALKIILNKLRSAGYSISFNLYDSANFGSPQNRERVIMLCHLGKEKVPYLIPTNSNSPEFGLPRWNTLRDAIGKINDSECTHISFPEKRLKYYRLLKSGENWRNLPDDLQKEAMGASFYLSGGKTGFYRRLSWDKPCPTLVTHPAMPATDLAHPEKDRPLSVEEYKLIQEFPEHWQIQGKILDQYKQIGNAVPVSLGKAVGNLLNLFDSKQEIKQFPRFPYSRYRNTDEISWEEQFDKLHSLEIVEQSKMNFGLEYPNLAVASLA